MRIRAITGAILSGLAAGLCVFAIPVGAAPVLGDPCPNGDVRQAQGTADLPDCMALEQVSPQMKHNQPAKVFQRDQTGSTWSGGISPDGNRVLFLSLAPLGGTPALADAFGDYYVASRDGSVGWDTAYTSPPVGSSGVLRGWEAPIPKSFSPDFSRWFQLLSTDQMYDVGETQAFQGKLGGAPTPFSPALVSVNGDSASFLQNVLTAKSRGSSSDGSHFFFSPGGPSTTSYLPGDPSPSGVGVERNAYVARLDTNGHPLLELLARDSAGTVWGGNCGAAVGAVGGKENPLLLARNRGAISADGSITYFTTRPGQLAGPCDGGLYKKRIMVREETPAGVEIRELFPSPPGGGDDVYQGASLEGTKIYLTTPRALVASDLDATNDLYLYDRDRPDGERLTQVSAGGPGDATPGAGARVLRVEAVSGDGSHVYFVAEDVLTTAPGPGGAFAQPDQPNLYLFERSSAHPDGRTAFIATLAASDFIESYPVPFLGADPEAAGIGGNGHRLFFRSKVALTVDDEDGLRIDLFRYDAAADSLLRISKAEPGGADNGSVDIDGGPGLGAFGTTDDNAPDVAVRSRWVSEDGETVVFKTVEGLLDDDTNQEMDSYVWRQGRLFRLPGTADGSGKLDDKPLVSLDGEVIAFQSFQPLVSQDRDSAGDVYVARVEGGFLESVDSPCVLDGRDGCQGPVPLPPGGGSATSVTFTGRGDLVEEPKRPRCPKGKRKVRRNGKFRCVPKAQSGKRKGRKARKRPAGGNGGAGQ